MSERVSADGTGTKHEKTLWAMLPGPDPTFRRQRMSTIERPEAKTDRRETERVFMSQLNSFKRQLPDSDPVETQEWVDALDEVVQNQGKERADWLLRRVLKRARQLQVGLPGLVQSRYINTLSPEQEPAFPGDEQMELRI